MPTPLPFLVRVAAGLVADAVATVRRLPEELPALPIELAGRVARVSLRVNQQLSELASKGDQALAGLPFGGREDDMPERAPWSRIDDEDDDPAVGPAPQTTGPTVPKRTTSEPAAPQAHEDEAAEVSQDSYEELGGPALEPDGRNWSDDADDLLTETGAGEPVERAVAGPPELPGYDLMTVAKIRSTLPSLSSQEVSALLAYELAHAGRASVETLLTNRLTTLAGPGES